MNKTLETDYYGEALAKLNDACAAFNDTVAFVAQQHEFPNASASDGWDDVWKRLCALSAAVQTSEWAYRCTHPRREPDAVPKV